mgnify:CR=1 FL=1
MLGLKLARQIALHDDECQVMFASRLAKANGYRDLDEFCWMTNVPVSRLQTMDEETADLLATWSGVTAGRFQRFALTGRNLTTFGDATVRRSQLEMAGLRVCRHCLLNDLGTGQGRTVTRPYARATWRWRVIGTCPEHGCDLEAIPACDLTAWIARRGDALAANLPEVRKPEPVDVYFAGRVIGGAKTSEFLDELPAYVAAEFCTVIGHINEFAQTTGVRSRVPDGFKNTSCRREGYRIAREGRASILSFLSTHVSTVVEDVSDFTDVYGAARRWLRKFVTDADYRAVVELFQHHAEQHIPMAVGDVFLTEVKERLVHTIQSAAVEYQITPARVKSVAEKQGFTTTNPDGSVRASRVFPRGALHEYLVLESQLLTTTEAANALGCSWHFLDILLTQEHLPYHLNSEECARVYRRIKRASVDNLIAWLTLRKDQVSNDGLVSIPKATAICHCKTPEIISLIFSGTLKRISWSGTELQLRNLLVDPVEVLQHVALEGPGAFMDVAALEKALRTTTATVEELIKLQFLQVQMRPHPRTRVHQRFVHPLDVEGFVSKHVSLSAMARENGRQIASLKKALDKEGIKPIFEPTGKIARFYRRSDVRRLGLA